MDYEILGKNIKEARLDKRMTQEELAQAADCSVSHISSIENNHTKVSLSTLLRICNVLGTTIDSLMIDQYASQSSALNHAIMEHLQRYDENTRIRYLKILDLL